MSYTFSGFTEEEIRKLQSGNYNSKLSPNTRRYIKPRRRKSDNTVLGLQSNNLNDTRNDLPADAKLSPIVKNDLKPQILNQSVNLNSSTNESKENENPEISNGPTSNSITLVTSKIEKRVIDLDEFQARQKCMEEQNRRRKELLSKALADRTKQTEEEAKRLKEIKHEFKKLDELLSCDVAILRKQIETASLEFMEAQKRYDKAEKEFLDAKLLMHHKLEKKELLTEHLCAIIEKNEERKAEKLNELMNRLEVGEKEVTQTENTNAENVKIEEKAEDGQQIDQENINTSNSRSECLSDTDNTHK